MGYKIGIDASTTATGVALFKKARKKYNYNTNALLKAPDELSVKYHKTKKLKLSKVKKKQLSREMTEKRVEFMINNLITLFDNCQSKGQIDKIIMEDIYAKTDIFTMKMLGRLQGAVLSYCLINKITVVFKYPSSWRKDIGISSIDENDNHRKRPELKAESIKYVKNTIGIDTTDDIADAICLVLSDEDVDVACETNVSENDD